jgi:hypothetical protein
MLEYELFDRGVVGERRRLTPQSGLCRIGVQRQQQSNAIDSISFDGDCERRLVAVASNVDVGAERTNRFK